MTADSLSQAKLHEAMVRFKDRLEIEKLLAVRLRKCLDVIEVICKKIADSLEHDSIGFSEGKGIFSISANNRVLSFAAATGMASDARLKHPRGLMCCQILVLGHTVGQEESTLLDCFRVYADNTCSDGESTWKVDDDSASFESFLSTLIADHLLDSDFFWPSMAELPESMLKVPISQNKVQAKALEKTCIGFECALPSPK